MRWGSTDQFAAYGVKTLVYGGPGVGKTRLCATVPAPIILSAESGLLSLRQYKIPYIEIATVQDLNEARAWAFQSREAGQFGTFCLDSISDIAETVLSNEKKANRDGRAAYGNMADKVTEIIKSFRDLPGRHVYFSAKMEYQQDKVTGISSYGPSMPGKNLTNNIAYFFDEVFHLGVANTDKGQVYSYLRTRADLQYQAKDRSGSLDVFEPPDLGYVFNKIAGGASAWRN